MSTHKLEIEVERKGWTCLGCAVSNWHQLVSPLIPGFPGASGCSYNNSSVDGCDNANNYSRGSSHYRRQLHMVVESTDSIARLTGFSSWL